MKPFKDDQAKAGRRSLTFILTLVIFSAFIATLALSGFLTGFLTKYDIFVDSEGNPSSSAMIAFMAGASLILGATASLLISKMPFRPIESIVDVAHRLSSGDYTARIEFSGMLANHRTLKRIEESINTLAKELQSTEMLRADFINNFSHEFKTPIVSIAGLTRLINRGAVTDEEREQYMKIIEEESVRLSDMATNVLNLTRVENQEILSERSRFNVSEQIRTCLLLAESKWVKKEIELQLDFDEYEVVASEELLKQVFINLIDNAIKFSPIGGTVSIKILDTGDGLRIEISNPSEPIPEDKRRDIFKKFYQLDTSHHTEGNGIGLAMVKKIAELHRGSIGVRCQDGLVTFVLTLPKE